MRRLRVIGLAGTLAALAACGDDADRDAAPAVDPAALPAAAIEPAPAAREIRADERLAVDSIPGLGLYLTDGVGRALYRRRGEPEGRSSCRDDCARVWPPFLASQGPPRMMAPVILPTLVDTIQRADSTLQIAYGGRVLYYYVGDTGPGTTNGQAIKDDWGRWFLVTPEGDPLVPDDSADSAYRGRERR